MDLLHHHPHLFNATKVHKLEQKKSIDVNLSNLKYQAGEMRAELQRANKELSKHHRQVLDARSRSEKSRKDSTRFDAKMKRAIGVARVLATYQNKVEAAAREFLEGAEGYHAHRYAPPRAQSRP